MARKRKSQAQVTTSRAQPSTPGMQVARDDRPESRRSWIGGLVIVLLAITAFLPALSGDFVWDDGSLIFNNPDVLDPAGWWRLWVQPRGVDYLPVTALSFWIEWRLWGDVTTGYHLVNMLLHAGAALLTWRLLRLLDVPAAWLGAALFAVHPVTVESVAWIAERKNVLSQVFFLSSAIAFLRFRNANADNSPLNDSGSSTEPHGRTLAYTWSIIAFVLALLAKASTVVLPAILLLIVWWQRRTITRRDLLQVLPYVVLGVVAGLATIWFQQQRAIGAEQYGLELPRRIAGAFFALGFYPFKALLPVGLVAIYPEWHRTLPIWQLLVPGIAVLGVLLLLVVLDRREIPWARAALFALLCYLVPLLPILGLLDMSWMRATLVADHFQYISLGAMTALAAAAVHRWLPRNSFQTVAAVLLAAGFGATWWQSRTYQGSEALWTHTLEHNPDAWIGHYNLGMVYYERGQFADAVRSFREAKDRRPDDVANQATLAQALVASGDFAGAVPELRRALSLYDEPRLRLELANALARQRQYEDAVTEYKRVLEALPNEIGALFNTGRILEMQGRPDEALLYFRRVIRVDPRMDAAHARIAAIESGLQSNRQ